MDFCCNRECIIWIYLVIECKIWTLVVIESTKYGVIEHQKGGGGGTLSFMKEKIYKAKCEITIDGIVLTLDKTFKRFGNNHYTRSKVRRESCKICWIAELDLIITPDGRCVTGEGDQTKCDALIGCYHNARFGRQFYLQ